MTDVKMVRRSHEEHAACKIIQHDHSGGGSVKRKAKRKILLNLMVDKPLSHLMCTTVCCMYVTC